MSHPLSSNGLNHNKGVAHGGVPSNLYPVVALSGPREKIHVNFGQAPFLWDFSFKPAAGRKSVQDYFEDCVEGSPGLWYIIDYCVDSDNASNAASSRVKPPLTARGSDGESFKKALPKRTPRGTSFLRYG